MFLGVGLHPEQRQGVVGSRTEDGQQDHVGLRRRRNLDQSSVPVTVDAAWRSSVVAGEAVDGGDDGPHPCDGLRERSGVPYVTDRDLDAEVAQWFGPPRFAGQDADTLTVCPQRLDEVGAEQAGATGHENHAVAPTADRTAAPTSASPVSTASR